jgi:hypothetical protein
MANAGVRERLKEFSDALGHLVAEPDLPEGVRSALSAMVDPVEDALSVAVCGGVDGIAALALRHRAAMAALLLAEVESHPEWRAALPRDLADAAAFEDGCAAFGDAELFVGALRLVRDFFLLAPDGDGAQEALKELSARYAQAVGAGEENAAPRPGAPAPKPAAPTGAAAPAQAAATKAPPSAPAQAAAPKARSSAPAHAAALKEPSPAAAKVAAPARVRAPIQPDAPVLRQQYWYVILVVIAGVLIVFFLTCNR